MTDPQATCICADYDTTVGHSTCGIPCPVHSDPTAKAREIAKAIAHKYFNLSHEGGLVDDAQGIIAAALDAERKAGREEAVRAASNSVLVQVAEEKGYRRGLKDARDEDWKQWLEAYRSMKGENESIENALWKCGKEIGKRVANEGWMNILPEQFKIADAEGYSRGLEDALKAYQQSGTSVEVEERIRSLKP